MEEIDSASDAATSSKLTDEENRPTKSRKSAVKDAKRGKSKAAKRKTPAKAATAVAGEASDPEYDAGSKPVAKKSKATKLKKPAAKRKTAAAKKPKRSVSKKRKKMEDIEEENEENEENEEEAPGTVDSDDSEALERIIEKACEHYDEIAAEYDHEPNDVLAGAIEKSRQVLVAKAKQLPPGGALLDLACGTGMPMKWLKEAGIDIDGDGVDCNEGMLKEARDKNVYRKLVKAYVLPKKTLPQLKAHAYDIVLCLRSVCRDHVNPRALPDFLYYMKEGGLLMVSYLDLVDQKSNLGHVFEDLVSKGFYELEQTDKCAITNEPRYHVVLQCYRKMTSSKKKKED